MQTVDPSYSSELLPAEEGREGMIRLKELDSATCLAWETQSTSLGKRLFIKQLRPELAGDARYHNLFAKEFSLGKKLSSVYFPRYHDLEETQDGVFMSMDFIDGLTLDKKVDEDPHYFCQMQNLMRFIRQLLESISDLHKADIIHLDLKPSNIIITKRTNNVRIIDFGYSCSSEWNSSMGMTREFSSPEQSKQQLDKICAASDIYSFGKIIQYVVWCTGCKLPHYLRVIINRCIAEDIDDRFATAQQILYEIDAHDAMKKKHTVRVAILSILATTLLFAGIFFGYKYFTQTEFVSNGLRYKILKDVWVLDKNEDVVELMGKTEDADTTGVFSIPNTVEFRGHTYKVFQVGVNAFENNSWIKKVIFPKELRFALGASFMGCKNLEEVDIQENVSFVEEDAFAECYALKTIKVNKKNPYIDVEDGVLFRRDPFHLTKCLPDNRREYTVPDGVKMICHYAFDGCKNLTTVTIPEGVEKIHPNAFQNCTSLTSIVLPSSVVDIENSVFENCTSLQSVTIGNRAVILGLHTFEKCRSLKQITIPASMIRIEQCCFNGCDSLETVVNLATEPQDLPADAFSHYGNLYVPVESVEKYKAAPNWNKFHIHGIDAIAENK